MEATAVQCLSSYAKLSQSSNNPTSSFFKGSSTISCQSVSYSSKNVGFKRLLSQKQQHIQCIRSEVVTVGLQQDRKRILVGVVHASSEVQTTPADTASDPDTEKWLLTPVGDGDWKHIGYKVQMPGSYEIVSSQVTVGRVPDRADLVIPVATVSGIHARIEKKDGSLYITDLGSTNGTFVGEKRVTPGSIAIVPPGSLLVFGDTHLAIFRVSKLENVQVEAEPNAEETSESAN